jgi:hypothetical protein
MGKTGTLAELSECGLFAFGLCGRGPARFRAGFQAFNIFAMLSTDAPVLFSSSRHALSSI